MNAHGLPPDLDDALYQALLNTVGCGLAFAATEAVSQVLAARRDAITDILAALPDPPARRLDWLLGSGL